MFFPSEHVVVTSTGTTTQGSKVSAFFLVLLLIIISAAWQAAHGSTTGSYDGPAELPRVLIQTTMADTPAPGITITVNSGGDFQSALENARCGDTIRLQAGATFSGIFTFPNKSCDDNHWVIVRTSSDDSLLPPEGSRLTPCYAGVSSLPGRPAFNCSSTKNVMAKLVMNRGKSSGPVQFAAGANHYRLIGLELTRVTGTGVVYALASPTAGAVSSHIIYDRIWFRGTEHDETTRGVQLGSGRYISVIDSFFTDFHCIAVSGSCTDSQAINGGNSFLPTGPYKIVNNFLEAAAENIMFGGAVGSTVPADIEIRRNHMFKPLTWMKGQPGYVGGNNGDPFIVKNLFEIKNAERVLFEGNVMQNSWGGFSQVGWGIVITPRGSWAADRDITIRYNTISHVGSGFQICASQYTLPSGVTVDSIASERISIHDVTVDDMSASTYNGDGIAFEISSGLVVNRPLNNLTIDHVTMLTDPKKTLLSVGADYRNPLLPFNIVFTNNIAVAGSYSVWSTGGTYTGTCAKSGQPLTTFNQCWSSYTASNNAIIAYRSSQGPWPKGNFFAANDAAVGFTDFHNGNGGDYQLLPTSPYIQMGIPGQTPLGADIPTLRAKTAGVL
jgi:hypothetical protein